MSQKKKYIITAVIAILHNNKRYEYGDAIELTDEEAENLSIYIEAEKPKQSQAKEQEKPEAQEAPVEQETLKEPNKQGKGKK